MRSIRVNFEAGGAVIDFNSEVDDFWPTVQNAVVFVASKSKSDKIYPKKGTDIHTDAVSGGVITSEIFARALQDVAVKALQFSNRTEDENNEHELSNFNLNLVGWHGSSASVTVDATSSQGEKIITEYAAE